MEYQGKTDSVHVILIVMEKALDWGDLTGERADSLRAKALQDLRAQVCGKYSGQVITPWTGAYSVAVEFREDGTYSAFNTEVENSPAFYYGIDEDSPERTWSLLEMNLDGSASGACSSASGPEIRYAKTGLRPDFQQRPDAFAELHAFPRIRSGRDPAQPGIRCGISSQAIALPHRE